ncbi:MAG: mevalonate kinase [bacterium]
MKPIQYSAPGKVILSGEHAVVYGKPALVCAIDRRLSITFTPAEETKYLDAIFPLLEKSVIDFLIQKKISIKERGYTYTIESSIPIGRGLGSSAAYCACISAGLLELFTGREWSKEDVNMCAYQMEKYFHKNSSGVDTSTSIMGGLVYYRKEFEFLKTISSLAVKIPQQFTDHIFLVDTGKPVETTGEMVHTVGALFNKKSDDTERILNEVEKTTKRFIVSIMKKDTSLFKENIQKNQELLEQLGVVSQKTKKLLSHLKNGGTGKVTGAGGKKEASGYVLFYCDDAAKCRKILEDNTILYMSFIPSYKGLVKEL